MKVTELRNQHISVQRVQQPGDPLWAIRLTDRNSGDETWLAINDQVRGELVRMLTSGIVIANGEPQPK